MFKLSDLVRLYRTEAGEEHQQGGGGAEPPAIPPATGEQGQEQDPPPATHWAEKRLGEMAARRRAAEQRAADLEAELQQLRAAGGRQPAPQEQQGQQGEYHQLTQAEIDEIAELRANQMLEQREQQRTQQSAAQVFNDRLTAVDKEATEQFGDSYTRAVNNLQNVGVGGREFLDVLTRNKNAGAILTWMGHPDNLDEAARLAALDPVDLAFELAEVAPKAVKATAATRTKAPAPLDTLNGRGGAPSGRAPDPKDTAAWIAHRNAQVAERNKGRRR